VQGPLVGLFVFTHEPLHDGPLQRQQRPSQARKHTTTRDVTAIVWSWLDHARNLTFIKALKTVASGKDEKPKFTQQLARKYDRSVTSNTFAEIVGKFVAFWKRATNWFSLQGFCLR
jgi:hypothetical protein